MNNLKIAIITYSRAINYGSVLQTYALNYYLKSIGYDVQTIDYTTADQRNLYKLYEPITGLTSIARNIQSFINNNKLKTHILKFERFLTEHVTLTPKIESQDDLDALNNTFDYFICGSDQVWNINCHDFNSNYMLSFVRDKKKCIAYAPSLGSGVNNPATNDIITKYASDFKALSSREYSGSKIISNATSQTVLTVADPVFLLNNDQWSTIETTQNIKGNYILGYFIGDRPNMRRFANKMQQETKLPVVVIYKNLRDIKYGFKNLYECGPSDFISLIKYSKGIVTNSFHAVAFSLIFQKDFWVFMGKDSIDSRISGLLEILNLQDRIVDNHDIHNFDFMKNIQYTTIDMNPLEKYINRSKEYLIQNLS